MQFDYSKLRGRIVEKFGTMSVFAKAMGWSLRTMSLKMTNARFWKQSDIEKAINLLEIDAADIPIYFFVRKVQSAELSE